MSQLPLLDELEHFVELGLGLAREQNRNLLLERILQSAMQLAKADGGTIYEVTPDNCLRFSTLINQSLNLHQGGSSGVMSDFPDIPLTMNGIANHQAVVSICANEQRTLHIDNVYESPLVNQQKAKEFDEKTGYHTQSLLTVPLLDHQGQVTGVLQLVNSVSATGEIQAFSQIAQRYVQSLASIAAMVMTNRQLINDLQQLFEAVTQLMAKAIDEKSPYTGGHCKRVPAITMLLAEACVNTTAGPLADFQMSDADVYELSVAAWMHDCGKIATPEYIMDKATKLHGLFDNIELVAARFEIVRRDIQYDHQLSEEERALKLTQLDADLLFLQSTNIGGEYMSMALQGRVRQIAADYHFMMNGISHSVLNAQEVINLCVERGTLNAEERSIVNRHIDITIEMLESLPFPKHLQNVPEFAGGHHEKMDGTGYPRKLKREQMSVQARIMAIADIFEALTANDRPYKKAKTLSESLGIMAKMARDQHVDADLFRVFVEQGVYLQFAQQFLAADQIDEVDINKLLEVAGC